MMEELFGKGRFGLQERSAADTHDGDLRVAILKCSYFAQLLETFAYLGGALRLRLIVRVRLAVDVVDDG